MTTGSNLPASFLREQNLIRLLMSFLAIGLVFMVLPGTLLGVVNLIKISSAQSASSPSTAWIQAHGHAQLFGWIGSFVLGISFYSIPNLRTVATQSFWEAWLACIAWTVGVALRWMAGIYAWQWHVLLPASAVLEVIAVAIICTRAAQGYRLLHQLGRRFDASAVLILGGMAGFFITVLYNCALCLEMAYGANAPIIAEPEDKRFIVLAIWGFAIPMIWGLTSKWMPVFLGLKPTRVRLAIAAYAINVLGIFVAMTGKFLPASVTLLAAAITAPVALRLFESADKPAKLEGVHQTFPIFVRVAYGWLIIATSLLIWATAATDSAGIMGAARHAVTVGCLATMVFSVAPRVLPSFLGRKQIASTRLMFLALALITTGCTLRVSCEILAYQHFAPWAWGVLPISAIIELTAVIVFATNMTMTFFQEPILKKVLQGRK